MSSELNKDRANSAIPAQPQDLDDSITAKPFFKKESELRSLIDNLPLTGTYGLANQQGDLSARKQEYEAFVATKRRGFTHTPNVLDSYANYTYHIRWSITDDVQGSNIQSQEEFANVKKIVIAESGVTAGFNIIDFELENLCAPNEKTKTTTNVRWKMTVKEPYGLSLIDKIYTASRIMGVKNHLTNSVFIELWFTGYNENGTIATTELKTNLYKLLRVIVTKCDSETQADGTTYRLEGLFDNNYANSDHIEIATQSLNIGPVFTIGSFFKGLQVALNAQQENLAYDFKKRVEYDIQVPNWMADWKFSRSPKTSARSSSIDVADKNNLTNPTISIARGMDMSTILYTVVSMTEEGQKFIAGESRQPNSNPILQAGRSSANSISANGMANLILIHSKSQIIGFDYLTNDYVRRIIYTFTEYATARAMVDRNNVTAAQQPSQQADRERTLINSGRYKKVYEYIYTGNNLDVLKLDIKLSWFWQTPIPNQLGENIYSNYTVPGQVNQGGPAVTVLNQYRAAKARLVKAQTQLDLVKTKATSARNANDITASAQLQRLAEVEVLEARREVEKFGSDYAAKRFQVLWDDRSAGSQALAGAAEANNDRVVRFGDQSLLRDPAVARDIVNRQLWKNQQDDPRKNLYLEDLPSIVVETPLPLSFRITSEPLAQATTIGGDGTRPENASANQGADSMPRGRSLISTVLNDVTTSPYFAKVELEIRGDPYWIGFGNVEEDRIIGNGNRPIPTDTSSAWFYNGELGFLLTFRTGEEPNEKTGLMEFSNSAIAFTGLYNVVSIRSVFSGGKFTQTLSAIRDNLYVPKSAQGSTGAQ